MTYLCPSCGIPPDGVKGTMDITEYGWEEVIMDNEGDIEDYGDREITDSDTGDINDVTCNECGAETVYVDYTDVNDWLEEHGFDKDPEYPGYAEKQPMNWRRKIGGN
jgi:predicted GNAT family acetyltransferase